VIAPMIANGVLISGMGGATAPRAASSTATTRTPATVVAPLDDPGARRARLRDLAEPDQARRLKYGGGATWQMASYDPQLDLLYIGTGNAEPYNPTLRDGQDCLYTASILALRPKTGELLWYYRRCRMTASTSTRPRRACSLT